jgi:hypothetical protein
MNKEIKTTNRFQLCLAAAVALLFSAGWTCGPSITKNPGFDLWCGNTLCAWTVDQGEIARVATWHRSDYGVELRGNPVVMSQLVEKNAQSGMCHKFIVQAQRDPDADLSLQMDFFDDGKTDFSRSLNGANWARYEYYVIAPVSMADVRVRITKTGTGNAILSLIRLEGGTADECTGPLVEIKDRSLNAPCENDAQCTSGRCTGIVHAVFDFGTDDGSDIAKLFGASESLCTTCDEDGGTCLPTEVCGMTYAEAGKWSLGCVEPGQQQLGDRCFQDSECKSGTCCGEVCSECCHKSEHFVQCANLENCVQPTLQSAAPTEEYDVVLLPWQCDPGKDSRPAAESCFTDGDCASGKCESSAALQTCTNYGNRCTDDTNCHESECYTVGKLEGVCQ